MNEENQNKNLLEIISISIDNRSTFSLISSLSSISSNTASSPKTKVNLEMSFNLKFIISVILITRSANSFKIKKHKDEDLNTYPRSFTMETSFVASTTDLVLPFTASSRVIRWKSLNEQNVSINDESSSEPTLITEKDVPLTPITWAPLDNANTETPNTTDVPKKTENVITNYKGDVCEHYKRSTTKFDFEKMPNVWQTAYYQLPEKVQCFKIHIKRVSEKEKENYATTYGNFSGIVNWNECNLEIKAAGESTRKHFLQGINEDEGVMDNIIIIDDKDSDGPRVEEESADQWLVVQHLLLMRDCDTGGVVIFSKVPQSPRPMDIEYALRDFNEDYASGKMACDEEEVYNRSFDNEEEID